MPGSVFYSLCALMAAGPIALAIVPFSDRLPTGAVSVGQGDRARVEVSGPELNRIVGAGFADITSGPDLDGNWRVLISAKAGALPDDPVLVPHFRLAADLERTFATQIIRVTVRAKSSPPVGAEAFEVNYSAGKPGESGWQRFDLSSEFQDYSFEWTPPPYGDELGVDYLAIRPVVPEKTRSVEIASVLFEIVG
jgi:hypothetical protein